jgi:serine/threonine protein kinase/Tfp pilus assembly protein PilF
MNKVFERAVLRDKHLRIFRCKMPEAHMEKLSHYKILSKLGSGGMGEVFLAKDTRLDRTVALKILPAVFAADDQRMRRFVQEAKAASALDHPNVAQIFEIGEADGIHYIAMQYIEGQTLDSISKTRQLESSEIVDIAIQAADALDAANSKGIIHRDIKAANIMMNTRGQVKVLDFGLAKFETKNIPQPESSKLDTASGTSPGTIIGTVQYMSPEQALGKSIDNRSDIYSLGVVLYQLATGKLPFSGETPSATLNQILNSQPTAIARLNYNVDPELERIIRKCMEKDPGRRYQSANELEIDLKNLKRDSASDSDQSRTQPALKPDGKRVNPLYIGIAAIAVAFIAGTIFYLQWQGRSSIHSLAVLPFTNLRSDSESEYLSEGITESITNSMSPIPNLRVLSKGMVTRFKGKDIDPQKVGHDLNVDALVQGSLMQQGDTLVVNAELVRVSDGSQLWGQQYNRKLADILQVQQDISKQVSEQLRLKLTGEEKKRIQSTNTENTQAYQLYLKGRYYWNRRTGEGLKKAVDYFQKAVELDPTYARAYAGLADCYSLFSRYDVRSPKESFPLAKSAATKALQIDPSLAEAYISLGYEKQLFEWDWSGAEKDFKRGLELDPEYGSGHQWYSEFLMSLNRREEAIPEAKRAIELDPLSLQINSNLSLIYYMTRQYDLGIDQAKRTLELDPNYARGLYRLGKALIMKGRYEEAIAAFQKALSLSEDAAYLCGLATAYAASNKKQDALKITEQLEARSKNRYVSQYNIALIYVTLGDKENSFKYLQKAVSERDDWLDQIAMEPMWDPLRADPRYKDILSKMNFPE